MYGLQHTLKSRKIPFVLGTPTLSHRAPLPSVVLHVVLLG